MPVLHSVGHRRQCYDPSRVVHLFGDSICRGFALGQLGDAVPEDHPLHVLRSPGSTLDALCEANDLPERAVWRGPVLGVRDDGSPGLTLNAPELCGPPSRIRGSRALTWWRSRTRVPTVGIPSPMRPRSQRSSACWWSGPDLAVLLVTTDYPPAPPHSQWDLEIGDRSHNAVIRAIVTRYPDRVVLADWDAEQNVWRDRMLAEHGVDPFFTDGIHANVWGQLLLVRLLLHGAGIEITDVGPLADLLATNWQAVAYGVRVVRPGDGARVGPAGVAGRVTERPGWLSGRARLEKSDARALASWSTARRSWAEPDVGGLGELARRMVWFNAAVERAKSHLCTTWGPLFLGNSGSGIAEAKPGPISSAEPTPAAAPRPRSPASRSAPSWPRPGTQRRRGPAVHPRWEPVPGERRRGRGAVTSSEYATV